MSRFAQVKRQTGESDVTIDLLVDGSGRTDISTGVRFYDHMLSALGRHALFDLRVQASGDVDVDAHHTVEDVAVALGQALVRALGDKKGIRRFGDALIPMDETLVQCAVDLSGRAYCAHSGEPEGQAYAVIGGTYQGSLTGHVFETLSVNGLMALHVRVLTGRDPHHLVEAQFKAVGRALRAAASLDERETGVPSTKGNL